MCFLRWSVYCSSLAHRGPLTGLWNQKHFYNMLFSPAIIVKMPITTRMLHLYWWHDISYSSVECSTHTGQGKNSGCPRNALSLHTCSLKGVKPAFISVLWWSAKILLLSSEQLAHAFLMYYVMKSKANQSPCDTVEYDRFLSGSS